MRVSAPGHQIRANPRREWPPETRKSSGCSMPFLTRPCYRPCKKFISKNSPAILTRFDQLHLHAGDTWPCVGSHKLVERLELPVHISFACTCLPAPLDATLPSAVPLVERTLPRPLLLLQLAPAFAAIDVPPRTSYSFPRPSKPRRARAMDVIIQPYSVRRSGQCHRAAERRRS